MSQFKLELIREDESIRLTQPVERTTESMTERLNRWANECGFNNISTTAIDIRREAGQPTGITTIYNRNNEDAYTLESPVAGRFAMYTNDNPRHILPDNYTGQVAVKRTLIGYAALARINSAIDMQKIIGPIINESVKDFIDEFGNLGLGFSITALQNPTSDYFRDQENTAAVEFRLYLKKG